MTANCSALARACPCSIYPLLPCQTVYVCICLGCVWTGGCALAIGCCCAHLSLFFSLSRARALSLCVCVCCAPRGCLTDTLSVDDDVVLDADAAGYVRNLIPMLIEHGPEPENAVVPLEAITLALHKAGPHIPEIKKTMAACGAAEARQPQIIYQNGETSGFEMCFAIGSRHQRCRGSQPKHASNPGSVITKFKPHFIYAWGYRRWPYC